ncbi:MAG TPA: IPT/TIG domain-containing protein [Anaerolineales bacterium]|nr:IPT/TIG domain-containing protein [Anaerolineales bacterium]
MQRRQFAHRLVTALVLLSTVILQPINRSAWAAGPSPALTGLMPTDELAGSPGLSLTLHGTDFQNGAVAVWSRDGAPSDMLTAFVSDTELSADLPAEALQVAGVIQITVRSPDAQESSPLDFTVNNPVPGLGMLSPDHALNGDPDTVITLTGSGFNGGSVVLWNEILLATTFISDTELQATLTAALLARDGTGRVTVQNPAPGGGFSNSLSFSIQPLSNIWVGHSPEGGIILDLEIDPNHPAVVFAGTDLAGLFKSTDSGQTWVDSGEGMWPSLRVYCIAISPSDPATMLASTDQGVWFSHDAGGSWVQSSGYVYGGGFPDCAAFDPDNAQIVYASTTHGLVETTNGGQTWQEIGKNPDHYVGQMLLAGAGVLYEMDADYRLKGLWKTMNNGQDWTELTNGLPDTLVTAIGMAPSNHAVLYAGTDGYSGSPDTGLYKSINGGDSWTRVLAQNHFYNQIVIDKNDPNRVYVAAEDAFLQSTDGGTTWVVSEQTRRDIDTVGIDYAHSGRLLGGGWHGMFESTDNGATWRSSNTGLTAQQVTDLAYGIPTHTLYAATYQGGIWQSIDLGSTWKHLPVDATFLGQVVIDPNNADHLVVAPTGVESFDGGQNWSRGIAVGIGNNTFGPISNFLYSPGWYNDGDGIVYGGLTTDPQQILPACNEKCHVDTIVPDPVDASLIYAIVSIYADPTHYLYVTHDGGHSWSEGSIALGPTAYHSLAIDPLDPTVLYLAIESGFYKSTDRAATWQLLGTGPGWVADMAVDPVNDQVIYTAGSGVHRSVDAGKTWTYIGSQNWISEQVWAVQPIPPVPSETFREAAGGPKASVVSGAGSGLYAYFSADKVPTVLALSSKLVADKMPAGTTVGTLTTTDSNAGDKFSYALVKGTGGDNNGSFRISGDKLVTAKVLNRSVKSSYTVRLRSTDAGGLFIDQPFTITVTPIVPAPASPAQNEPLKFNRPLFDWGDVGSVLSYTLQVSRNTAFSGPVISVNIAASKYTVPTSLPSAATLYWRVRANFASGSGAWSVVWHFKTANPPGRPVLTSPANGSTVSTRSPRLTWNRVAVPAGTSFHHYDLQIATDAAFKALVADVNASGLLNTAFKPSAPLVAATRYYWRVRSFNTLGQYSDWSSAWSFRTPP